MEKKVDKIDKHYNLCQLYEQMDEKEREALIRTAGKLSEVQASMDSVMSELKVESNRTESKRR